MGHRNPFRQDVSRTVRHILTKVGGHIIYGKSSWCHKNLDTEVKVKVARGQIWIWWPCGDVIFDTFGPSSFSSLLILFTGMAVNMFVIISRKIT